MRVAFVVSLISVLAHPQVGFADLAVYVDFGVNWETRLNEMTTSAGVTAFDSTERTSIQDNIFSKLATAYSSYSKISFSGTPGGSTIDFDTSNADITEYGTAPLDFMNASAFDTARVYTANFGFVLDEFTGTGSRATQIAQISAALAGTAAHELGHTLGLRHHHAYGTEGIDPDHYANTGGLQNSHIMATGSTGLGETGRENDRTFSQYENLILEAAGGANAGALGTTGFAIADTVLMQSNSDYSTGDVGNATGSATTLSLTSLPISLLDAAHTLGRLSSDSDIDVFSFTVDGPGSLLAELWSEDRYNDSFDSRLRVYNTDGTTVLATNDDTTYSGNAFNNGTFRENDSTLVNISLAAAGTYYLEVTSVGNISNGAGGVYSLIFGFDADGDGSVPEPSSLGLFALGAAVFTASKWRQRRGKKNQREAA